MADLIVNLGLDELLAKHMALAGAIEAKIQEAGQRLALQVHAHLVESAQKKLRSTREMFLDNLSYKQVDPHLWVITLDAKAAWIDDGLPGFNMLDGLLKSPKAKTSKDGHKYIVVPFKHNKAPTRQTPNQQALANAVKAEFKKRKIPYGKIERNPDGSPKIGLLHKFDLDKPNRQNTIGAGQQGPEGTPWQTHPKPSGQEGPGGLPYLWGVRVYQREHKDSEGKSSVKKDVMTFRVASSKHAGQKWMHPGVEGRHMFEEAKEWALRTWETEIVPEILRELDIE